MGSLEKKSGIFNTEKMRNLYFEQYLAWDKKWGNHYFHMEKKKYVQI